jgi:hypothetical protein
MNDKEALANLAKIKSGQFGNSQEWNDLILSVEYIEKRLAPLKHPEFDAGEYPTDQTVDFIRHYDTLKDPVIDLIGFIIQAWHFQEWGVKFTGRELELHTGGWSGNESIIGAMMDNAMLWSLCWVKSTRGGHFWFELPDFLMKRKGVPPAEPISKKGKK